MKNQKLKITPKESKLPTGQAKIKNQKLLIWIILGSLLLPLASQAVLVPCGPGFPPPDDKCQLCHLFILLDNIIDFFLVKIALPIATLMLVIGGIMFFAAAGNPEKLTTAKSLITSVVIGLVIIFAAWLILGLFFQTIGLANWTKNIYQNWWQKGFFEIPCP